MKVYTKGGDSGQTSLIGGERVSKSSARLEAYGTVDELSAHVAFLRDSIIENPIIDQATITQELAELLEILHNLMLVSTLLAADSSLYAKLPRVSEENVLTLEKAIDRMSEELKPITRFTLPGGNTTISASHIARTVCRRAERAAIFTASQYEVDPLAVKYLNRLSDYLYVLGRLLTERTGAEELYWQGNSKQI